LIDGEFWIPCRKFNTRRHKIVSGRYGMADERKAWAAFVARIVE
jgi:hypothetical protein